MIRLDTSHQKQKCSNNKDVFENILISSKREPNLIKTDRTKEFHNNILQNLLKINNTKHYTRNTFPGTVLQNVLIELSEIFL